MVAYTITEDAVNVIVDGEFRQVRRDRADVDTIIELAEAAQSDPSKKSELLAQVTPKDRITLELDGRIEEDPQTGRLYLKGTDFPISEGLGERIISFLEEGHPVEPLLEFHKKCILNPDFPEIEDQLFGFLDANGHPITNHGFFIAYKKVDLAPYYGRGEEGEVVQKGISKRKDIREEADEPYVVRHERLDPDTGEVYTEDIDLSSDLRFVDLYTGEMDNSVGQVVSMDRDDVVQDPTRACGPGLHVASMSYLPDYGVGTSIGAPEGRRWAEMDDMEIHQYISNQVDDPVVEVLVNPRHVVSVPYDHDMAKMRTEQYYVHGLLQGEYDQDYAPIQHYVDQETKEMQAELEEQMDDVQSRADEKLEALETAKDMVD